MLTPEEYVILKNKIQLYSFETDTTINESEHTYVPSEVVCNVDDIIELLEQFTLPF